MKMGLLSKALGFGSLDLVMLSGSFWEDISRYWRLTNNNGSQTKIRINRKIICFFNYIKKLQQVSKGRKKAGTSSHRLPLCLGF